MEALLGLLLILGLMNESATPVWSEQPQECKELEYDEEVVDALTATKNSVKYILKNTQRKHHICVEEPEAIRLPSYIELLNLPAADEMPVVAVYGFLDKTGQRKERDGIADFSTATTQGGTELLIDALKTAGVPDFVHNQIIEKITIPMNSETRSLNLATSVAIVTSTIINSI